MKNEEGSSLVEVTQTSDIITVKIRNKVLDSANTKAFRISMINLYKEGKRNFIIDFAEVKFIDSSAIGVFLGLHKAIGENGILCFCNIRIEVSQIMSIVNLQRIIPIYNSVVDAMREVKKVVSPK